MEFCRTPELDFARGDECLEQPFALHRRQLASLRADYRALHDVRRSTDDRDRGRFDTHFPIRRTLPHLPNLRSGQQGRRKHQEPHHIPASTRNRGPVSTTIASPTASEAKLITSTAPASMSFASLIAG